MPHISSSTYPPIGSSTTARDNVYHKFSISSTPSPPLPIRARSDELLIEPAIIIRKKGSNKASILRTSTSGSSIVSLAGSGSNANINTVKSPTVLTKNENVQYASSYPASKTNSLAPLHLYEKQLKTIKTIMDVKKAYQQLLRSKVNLNFQVAAGKGPFLPSTTNNNWPFNRVVVLQEKDSPRRFDNAFENTTTLVDATPSTIVTHHQRIQAKPFLWRAEQIKNALKNFSPVPPLKQLVSYVSTSTESYLSQFMNNLANKNKPQVQIITIPETSTASPIVSSSPSNYLDQDIQDNYQFTPSPTLPSPIYPLRPYSTLEPQHDLLEDPSVMPIHEVYQNHDFKLLTTTPSPPSLNYYEDSAHQQPYSYLDTNPTTRFPFMNELMQEIARADYNQPPASPRTSPELTAVPTFQTPGPPYAEIDVVQPLSFLPPPQPEPATPTHNSFNNNVMSYAGSRHPPPALSYLPQQMLQRKGLPRPTVRVNLDKPIYIPKPGQQNNHPQYQIPMQPLPSPVPPPQPQFPLISYQTRKPQIQQPFLPQMPQQPQQQQQQNRRVHSQQSIITRHLLPHLHYLAPPPMRPHHQHQFPFQHPYHHPPPNYQRHQNYHHHNQPQRPLFFIPRPKHYRLVLKGKLKEAATRIDNQVPLFVSKLAHEFFKKPEIFVPKIRPGMPLTLEKVVLNHKEIVPKEVRFSQAPGVPATKLRFTPQAQWKMREEMAHQGIMLNEPIHTVRDYAKNDPNVMEMDAPIRAVNTLETHTGMGSGSYNTGVGQQSHQPYSPIPLPSPAPTMMSTAGVGGSSGGGIFQESHQPYRPILLPSPSPSMISSTTASPPISLDQQHQFELQHQLLLAQQHQENQRRQQDHQRQQQEQTDQLLRLIQSVTASPSPSPSPTPSPSSYHNNNAQSAFTIDPNDFNDFNQNMDGSEIPEQVNIPGVKQVVVDKFMVHDPLNPSGNLQFFSTTTVEPPLGVTQQAQNNNVDLAALLTQQMQFNQRHGMPLLIPTPPPAVLIRHHGAPSPSPPPDGSTTAHPGHGDVFVTVIKTTPKPSLDGSVASDALKGGPATVVMTAGNAAGTTSIVGQINDFLTDQMDFGARPEFNLYDMLFHSRAGVPANRSSSHESQEQDQIASATNLSMETEDNDKSVIDTDRVASIFSTDYKSKHNRKPPEVIVIKVPQENGDGPSQEIVKKRVGDEIEIIGGNHNRGGHTDLESQTDSEEEDLVRVLGEKTTSSSKRRRNRKGSKRKRKRRKKGRKRKKEKQPPDEYNDERDQNNDQQTEGNKTGNQDNQADVLIGDNKEAEQKFQSELDWKSHLMANICDLNPSSPLCLTYRSICLLMTDN